MALNNKELIVFNKENMFDFIFARDVAEGLVRIAEKVDSNEIVNLGSGVARRIEDVIKILQEYIPHIRIKEIKSNDPFEASCADISKLIELTGYRPPTTLEEGIRMVLEYEMRHTND